MPCSKRTLYGGFMSVSNDVAARLAPPPVREWERIPGTSWSRTPILFRGGSSNPDDAPLLGKRKVAENQELQPHWEYLKQARAFMAAWLSAADYDTDTFEGGKIVTRNDKLASRHAEYLNMASLATGGGVWKLPYARKERLTPTPPREGGFIHGGARSRRYYRISHSSGISMLVSAGSRYGRYINQNSSCYAPPASWVIEEVVAEGGINGMSIWSRANQLVREAKELGDIKAISAALDLKTRVCAISVRGMTDSAVAGLSGYESIEGRGFTIPQRSNVNGRYVVALEKVKS